MKITKTIILKTLPLIILYFLFIIKFLNNIDYEAIIILTASIILAIYIFNKDKKIEKVLCYILYLFIAGFIIYLINLFFISYDWFYFCSRNYYNETTFSILKNNQFFIYNFKYLIYIGIIFLAIKNKKYNSAI